MLQEYVFKLMPDVKIYAKIPKVLLANVNQGY
jgi:hypothetical protein